MASDRENIVEMKDASFTVSYDGEALRDGRMDAREVATALLAWADVIQEANDLLNDKRTRVHIRVGPQNRTGSHPIDFTIVMSLIDQAKTLFGMSDVSTATAIMTMIFGGGGVAGTVISVIELVKKLKGEKPAETKELQNGTVEIKQSNGNTITVTQHVYQLFNSDPVRNALADAVRPLRSPGIDVVDVEVLGRGGPVKVETITDEDLPAFELEDVQPGKANEVLSDSTYETVLVVDRPHFRRGHRWGVVSGGNQFGVSIADDEFLEEIRAHRLRFGADDMIRVRIRAKTWRDDEGRPQSSNVVEKVLEVIYAEPVRQKSLLEPPPDDKKKGQKE